MVLLGWRLPLWHIIGTWRNLLKTCINMLFLKTPIWWIKHISRQMLTMTIWFCRNFELPQCSGACEENETARKVWGFPSLHHGEGDTIVLYNNNAFVICMLVTELHYWKFIRFNHITLQTILIFNYQYFTWIKCYNKNQFVNVWICECCTDSICPCETCIVITILCSLKYRITGLQIMYDTHIQP